MRLQNLTIEHGKNGVYAERGAQLTILNSSLSDNALNGFFLADSGATIINSSTRHNGNNGLDAEASSAIILTGDYTSDGNGIFEVNINASSSLTFSRAHVTVSRNILGVQIGTSASAFISDPTTTLAVKDNATTGLTIVSGSHMVAFGGTIQATGNDLNGVHLEETSVLTMFNTPPFSGAPGTTTLVTESNGQNGISVLTGSNLTVIHQASITSYGNVADGIEADNGSAITLIQSSVTGQCERCRAHFRITDRHSDEHRGNALL